MSTIFSVEPSAVFTDKRFLRPRSTASLTGVEEVLKEREHKVTNEGSSYLNKLYKEFSTRAVVGILKEV